MLVKYACALKTNPPYSGQWHAHKEKCVRNNYFLHQFTPASNVATAWSRHSYSRNTLSTHSSSKQVRCSTLRCGLSSCGAVGRGVVRNLCLYAEKNVRIHEFSIAMWARRLHYSVDLLIKTYTEPVSLKCGNLATKYPCLYGYFYSVGIQNMPRFHNGSRTKPQQSVVVSTIAELTYQTFEKKMEVTDIWSWWCNGIRRRPKLKR